MLDDRGRQVNVTANARGASYGSVVMVPSVSATETEWTLRCCPRCLAIFRTSFIYCPNDGSAVDAVEHDPLIGRTVGPYVVDAFLGAGAVARVYRVHRESSPRHSLALKIMLGDFTTSAAMRIRFEREAAAASGLAHPNVVAVVDHGSTDGGLLYLAMELVDGVALSNIIGDHSLPVSRVIHLARQMCQGLAHAHRRGFVHRDFKPENVMVIAGPGGEVTRIADFGLAISIDATAADVRLTGVGAAVGTPSYAAPEQVFGTALDGRADLFALGVTMYEMLAGALPFDGTPLEVIHLNASVPPPPIGDRAPGTWVPPRLERLVRRLMEPRPEQRPASALEVLAELDAIEQGERPARDPLADTDIDLDAAPGATLRYYRTDRIRACRPRRSVIALAMVAAIGLIAATSVAVVKARSAQSEPARAPAAPSGLTVSPITSR
jgi:serine/threonine protein kinase